MAAYIKGPWSVDAGSMGIWAPSENGGETKIFDIRGWGYLTGHGDGGMRLSRDEAVAIQRATGLVAAAGPDLLEAAEALIEKIAHVNGIEAERAALIAACIKAYEADH